MAVRFDSTGDLVVSKGVKSVDITLEIKWNDNLSGGNGLALWKLSFEADGKTVEWSRSTTNNSGTASRSAKLSSSADASKVYHIDYRELDLVDFVVGNEGRTAKPKKKSDTRISFNDGGDDEFDVVITLSVGRAETFEGVTIPPGSTDTVIDTTGGCPPGPWSIQPTPPACGSPPSGISISGGLQIRQTGQNQVTLNLKNYADKLVTLKITHQVEAAWTQSFSFSIPTCSDASWTNGGVPYARPDYVNNNISGTNIFYAYNVDGGDYDYVFNSGSVAGPAPTRQLFTQSSSTVCDAEGKNCVTTYFCVPSGTETFSPWPYCPTGVAISSNGGNKVQWQYEDGGGGDYEDQFITVEVVSERNVIGSLGPICTSALKNNVWVEDPTDIGAKGNCISDYRDHSQKIRFRMPSSQSSKLSLPVPTCYKDFRGIAGAIPPEGSQGSISSEYPVLHLFDRDFKTTTSLVYGNGIIVTAVKGDDSFISPYNEPNPNGNTNLGTQNRKHYLIDFVDNTPVSDNASNINISIGQNITADGINATAPNLRVFKKEKAGPNSLRVWFYLNHKESQSQTDDIIHVFNDSTNQTIDDNSNLQVNQVTVTPQSTDDPGNGTAGYETLNATNKKHYLVTFADSDPTIVNGDASNITFEINQNITASGVPSRITLVKREQVSDKSLRVWFTAYDASAPAGRELDNTFVRDFSISRIRDENFSGNVFVRNWYLSKNI